MREQDNTPLKPCPFCGGQAIMLGGPSQPGWWIECVDCLVKTLAYVPLNADPRPMLVREWNRRHIEAPPEQPLVTPP